MAVMGSLSPTVAQRAKIAIYLPGTSTRLNRKCSDSVLPAVLPLRAAQPRPCPQYSILSTRSLMVQMLTQLISETSATPPMFHAEGVQEGSQLD